MFIRVVIPRLRPSKARTYLAICFAALLALSASAALGQSKDTLYFYNKTKIVGELLKIRYGRVDIDADGLGIVTIKNNKISSMHATSRNFRVETLQGEVLEGYLTRSDTAGMVWVSTPSKRKKIHVNDIVEMSYYGKTWKSRITGNASSGLAK
ncbi:MAG TPA: hypothetical protein VIU12_24820 [Chryseolinea sp.]